MYYKVTIFTCTNVHHAAKAAAKGQISINKDNYGIYKYVKVEKNKQGYVRQIGVDEDG